MKPIVTYNGEKLFLNVGEYSNNGRMYIGLMDKYGELWDDLTINLPEIPTTDGAIFINSSIPKDLRKKLIKTDVFINMYSTKYYNMEGYETFYVNKKLLEEYTNNDLYIQTWRSEIDRNQGNMVKDDVVFNDFDSAVEYARKEFYKNKYASLEIVDSENKSYFCKDKESEEFYIYDTKISRVSKKLLGKYIDCWNDKKDLPIKENLLYAKEGNHFVAVDNTTGDCWTEDFDNEKDAQAWLLGKSKEEIKEEQEEDLVI